jgi:hypothetical protein
MEIQNIPFKPWEYMTYTIERSVIRSQYGVKEFHSYPAQFETMKCYNRSYWKPGDVVKFGNGILNYITADTWRNWFLNEDDLDIYLKKNKLYYRGIPAYARNQYAIILARYKWTKLKDYINFRDYGTFIMMLTGSKVGYIRKYYITTPWTEIGRFPYTKMKYNKKAENLFQGIEIEDDSIVFLENLVRKLSHGN